jgi:hypothetical protein
MLGVGDICGNKRAARTVVAVAPAHGEYALAGAKSVQRGRSECACPMAYRMCWALAAENTELPRICRPTLVRSLEAI